MSSTTLLDNSKEFPGRAAVCSGEQYLVNGMKEFQCVKTRKDIKCYETDLIPLVPRMSQTLQLLQ